MREERRVVCDAYVQTCVQLLEVTEPWYRGRIPLSMKRIRLSIVVKHQWYNPLLYITRYYGHIMVPTSSVCVKTFGKIVIVDWRMHIYGVDHVALVLQVTFSQSSREIDYV